jgi:hypothetical protein
MADTKLLVLGVFLLGANIFILSLFLGISVGNTSISMYTYNRTADIINATDDSLGLVNIDGTFKVVSGQGITPIAFNPISGYATCEFGTKNIINNVVSARYNISGVNYKYPNEFGISVIRYYTEFISLQIPFTDSATNEIYIKVYPDGNFGENTRFPIDIIVKIGIHSFTIDTGKAFTNMENDISISFTYDINTDHLLVIANSIYKDNFVIYDNEVGIKQYMLVYDGGLIDTNDNERKNDMREFIINKNRIGTNTLSFQLWGYVEDVFSKDDVNSDYVQTMQFNSNPLSFMDSIIKIVTFDVPTYTDSNGNKVPMIPTELILFAITIPIIMITAWGINTIRGN